MADNKANALKEANNKYQLKIYYEADGDPFDCGSITNPITLSGTQFPVVFKVSAPGAKAVAQFVDSAALYHTISKQIGTVLDAVLVNAKQRDAVNKIIDDILSGELLVDKTGDNEEIFDIETAELE